MKIMTNLILVFHILLSNGLMYGQLEDAPKPVKEFYSAFGYKALDEALKETEQHFNQSVKLPVRMPAISFTHCFGRLNDLEGDMNDTFDMKCIHEHKPEHHYSIEIRPIERKIPIREADRSHVLPLENGKQAKLLEAPHFHVLFFETDEWQYQLSIDKRLRTKVTVEELIEIANSLE